MNALTKSQLKEWGFQGVEKNGNEYLVRRVWKVTNSKKTILRFIKVHKTIVHHRFAPANIVLTFNFSVNGKQITLSLARYIYAYYNGEVSDKHYVTHKDEDPCNCDAGNLELITKEEMLKRRFQGEKLCLK